MYLYKGWRIWHGFGNMGEEEVEEVREYKWYRKWMILIGNRFYEW